MLPLDVRDWLPGDHLAWFVIDAVTEMDLAGFYAAYRADGHGRAAYEPSLMVTLILYGFATGVRSSRRIECHCGQDVAYRVITGNLVPDHATIARFIDRHKRALAALFTEVLKLCAEAGLVQSGVVAIDGTRIAGNASPEVNCTFEQIAMEIIATTVATDQAEDEQLGEQRGDELPEQLRSPAAGASSLARSERSAGASASAQSALTAARHRRPSQSAASRRMRARRRRAMRCPSSSTRKRSWEAGARAVMPGCGRTSANWRRAAGSSPTRSRVRARSACWWRPSA